MANTVSRKNNLDFSNFLPSILILAFLCVGFIPNWGAVDKIAPQWLYLSILNFVSAAFLFYQRNFFIKNILSVLSSKMSLTYILFVIWAALSFYYSINQTEVLVNLARQLNTVFMLINLGVLIYNINKKSYFLSICLMLILCIELYSVLVQALEMYNSDTMDPGLLKGVTANRNITAFSIAIKIPFIIYLILISKKFKFKLFYASLIFLCLFSLSMIQSRASFIAVFMIGIVIFSFSFYNYLKTKKLIELKVNLFYLIPFLLAIFLNQTFISSKGVSAVERAVTLTNGTSDDSINQRFRYYQDVFTQISETPIFGVGLGNWKIKSIYHDREDIDGYIVPYHAHSDFIQLGAELGIVGFLLYLGIFLIAGYFAFSLLLKSKLNYNEKWFTVLLISSLGVYFIDANLNFPIARPQVLAPWALIMALLSYFFYRNKRKNDQNLKTIKLFGFSPLLIMIIMIFPISISYKTYQSHKGQLVLLRDFNSNKYSVPLNQVENITPDIPNITVTTIPMETIKARYFINAKKYDKALKLLNNGLKANPYLFISENLKAQVFLNQGKIDSAYVNAKKAFYGLPKNALHATTYAQILGLKKDIKELLNAFTLLSKKSGSVIWKNFLVVLSQNSPPKDPDLIRYSSKAVELFPDDNELFAIKKISIVGQSSINQAAGISQKGLDFFNSNKFLEAAIEFEKASEIDFLEYAHIENAASAYLMAGDNQNALELSQKVINEFNVKTGKSEYINGLAKFNINLPDRGCEMLQKAIKLGYNSAQNTFDQRCK